MLANFGGLEVACWLLVPKFAGSNTAEGVAGFSGPKKSSARLHRRGSKSHPVPCRRIAACKRTLKVALTLYFQAKFTVHSRPIVPPFTDRVPGVTVKCKAPGGPSWNVYDFGLPCSRSVLRQRWRTLKVALTRYFQAKITGHFSTNSSTFHC
jgi:hypothetical protein